MTDGKTSQSQAPKSFHLDRWAVQYYHQ